MAFIFRHGNSSYWHASIKVYDAEKEKWIHRRQSTRLSDERKAKEFARVLQEAANAMGPKGQCSKEFIEGILSRMLAVSGHAQHVSEHKIGEEVEGWMKRCSPRWTVRTQGRYLGVMTGFLNYIGEDFLVRKLKIEDVEKFYQKALDEGLSPKTAQVEVGVIRSFLNDMRRRGVIDVNPASGLVLQSARSGGRARQPFNQEHIDKIRAECKGTQWETMLLLGLWVGCRIEDAAKMRWEDVDMQEGVIDYLPRKTQKNKRRAVVPLHPELDRYLLKIVGKGGQEWLCPTLRKYKSSGGHALSSSFARIVDKAGIDREMVREARGKRGRASYAYSFHSLRHTFNSRLADAGVSQEVRMALVGHQSEEVNAIYTHFHVDTLRQAVGKL